MNDSTSNICIEECLQLCKKHEEQGDKTTSRVRCSPDIYRDLLRESRVALDPFPYFAGIEIVPELSGSKRAIGYNYKRAILWVYASGMMVDMSKVDELVRKKI